MTSAAAIAELRALTVHDAHDDLTIDGSHRLTVHEPGELTADEHVAVVQAESACLASAVSRSTWVRDWARYAAAMLIPTAAAIWLHNAFVLLNQLL